MVLSAKNLFHLVHRRNAMPPSARVPVVEFRPLLLPPIRVSLRTVQSLYRPQCLSNRPSAVRSPQCLAQRRSLVLWKTAKSQTVLGAHTLLPFERYHIGDPGDSTHEVNLVRDNGKGKELETIAENISLEEVYEKYIKPGELLYLTEGITKALAQNVGKMRSEGTALQRRTYGIVTTGTLPGNKKDPDAGKGRGALRTTPLNLSSPADYFKMALDRSYQFIEHGSPVEFTIAIKRSPVKKEDKWKGIDDKDGWPWIHEHFPHLRPDFILKQMPEGSRWSVEPVSDGRLLQFVIIRPSPLNSDPANYTNRLFAVKESVMKHIARGRAQQLPKTLRAELAAKGHETYTPLSGMPITQEALSEGYHEKMQQETDDWRSPGSRDRYAPIEKNNGLAQRTDKLAKSGRLFKVGERRERSPVGAVRSEIPGFKKVDRSTQDEEANETSGARHESGLREERAYSSSRKGDHRRLNSSARQVTESEHDTGAETNESHDRDDGDGDGWGFQIRKHNTGPEVGPVIRHHETTSPFEDGPRIHEHDTHDTKLPRHTRLVAQTRGKTGKWSKREDGLERDNNNKYPRKEDGERRPSRSEGGTRSNDDHKYTREDGVGGGFSRNDVVWRRDDNRAYPRREGEEGAYKPREGAFKRSSREPASWSNRRTPSDS
jgi:hypothetical protein